LDGPNLALRLSHRRVRVLDALQVVSARGVTSNLALDHLLMFDHTVLMPRMR
jgi:hypothetical protein